MHKKIVSLFAFFMLAGAFAACSSPVSPLNSFTTTLGEMEDFHFTAVGSVSFEGASPSATLPTQYAMSGMRFGTDHLANTLHWSNASGGALFDLSSFLIEQTAYVDFIPLYRHLLASKYDFENLDLIPTLEDSFGGSPYLLSSQLYNILSHFPIVLPDFVALMKNQAPNGTLEIIDGVHTLHLQEGADARALIHSLTAPFGLLSYLTAAAGLGENPVETYILTPLLEGDINTYTLELVVYPQAETGDYIVWLTLHAPGLMTLTADITYHPQAPTTIYLPYHTMEEAQMIHTFATHREEVARVYFLIRSELKIVQDLPELHMVNHRLEPPFLIPFPMEIGGVVYDVSIMAEANNTATDLAVYSSTAAMTILYTALPAHAASHTMAPFVFEYFDIDEYDAYNYTRTAMRINAHDTAAVKGLFLDDNFVGRTLHIFVLQRLEDSDYALFLGIMVMLDNINQHTLTVLEQLGFHIGIDFSYYLQLAQGDF